MIICDMCKKEDSKSSPVASKVILDVWFYHEESGVGARLHDDGSIDNFNKGGTIGHGDFCQDCIKTASDKIHAFCIDENILQKN
jgi:hypothetical protein